MPIDSPVGPLLTVDDVRASLRATGFSDLERRFDRPAMVVVGPVEDWGPSTWTRDKDSAEPPPMMLPPLLVTLAPRTPGATRMSFGRSPPCDVVLPFRQLSRVHVVFSQTPSGSWCVEDVGSRNGTVLDGQPIPAATAVPLRDGAKLRFGDVIAHFMLPRALHEYLRRDSRPQGTETPRPMTPRPVR